MMSTPVLVTLLVIAAVAAWAVYVRVQHNRNTQVRNWIGSYLHKRCGCAPAQLFVNCSDDRHWPVLVSFVSADGLTRHRLRFLCPGATSTYALISESQEPVKSFA